MLKMISNYARPWLKLAFCTQWLFLGELHVERLEHFGMSHDTHFFPDVSLVMTNDCLITFGYGKMTAFVFAVFTVNAQMLCVKTNCILPILWF